MSYDFPSNPTDGQIFKPPVGGQTYVFKPPRWLVSGIPPEAGGGGSSGIEEAPVNGKQFARKDAAWSEVIIPAGDWGSITGKPATFPPSAHTHSESEVTGLVADLAAKAPLASPTLTGNPLAPTPAIADNSTSIATTAFVKAQGFATSAQLSGYLPLTGGTVTGDTTIFNTTLKGYSSGGQPNDALGLISNNLGAAIGVMNANAAGYSGIEYRNNAGAIAVFTGYNNGSDGEFRFNNISGANARIMFKINSNDVMGFYGSLVKSFQPIELPVDPTQPMHAATKQYVDNKSVDLSNYYTKAQVDAVNATQDTNIAAKEPKITAGTTAQYWRGDKAWATLDKTAVGLGNVDNTSDANKPVSTATQTALNGKEPTIAAGTSGQYWDGTKTWKALPTTDLSGYAPLASPAFTGTPTAPKAAHGDNTTKIATTSWVIENVQDMGFVYDYSPVFTGNPTAPTPPTSDNDTSIATTAFVKAAIAATPAPAGGALISDTPPASPTAGAIWWESDTGNTFVYYGTAWVQI